MAQQIAGMPVPCVRSVGRPLRRVRRLLGGRERDFGGSPIRAWHEGLAVRVRMRIDEHVRLRSRSRWPQLSQVVYIEGTRTHKCLNSACWLRPLLLVRCRVSYRENNLTES